MYETRSTLKLHGIPPFFNKKSLAKWIASQRAIVVQKENVSPKMLRDNISTPATIAICMLSNDFREDMYLLIQPIYDPDTDEISFFEDADGIPKGYDIKLSALSMTFADNTGTKHLGNILKFFLHNEEDKPKELKLTAKPTKKVSKSSKNKKGIGGKK